MIVLNPDIVLPTANKGYLLRVEIKSFLAALNFEYRLPSSPTFTTQVVLQLQGGHGWFGGPQDDLAHELKAHGGSPRQI